MDLLVGSRRKDLLGRGGYQPCRATANLEAGGHRLGLYLSDEQPIPDDNVVHEQHHCPLWEGVAVLAH